MNTHGVDVATIASENDTGTARVQRPPVVSIVICTYNRAWLLHTALDTMTNQTVDASRYEVLVVDNNSTDDTPSVVESFAHHGNVHYVHEARQGLSHARNRGWAEASTPYVGYLDDDCRVPRDWIAKVLTTIDRVKPDVFGGPYFAWFNVPKPAWYRYGSWRDDKPAGPLGKYDYLSGGNLFCRRDLLARLGGFRVDLGVSGRVLGVGEETELLRRIRETNPAARLYYDPSIAVEHLVRPEKLSVSWMLRRAWAEGRSADRVFGPRAPTSASRELLSFGWQSAAATWDTTFGLLLRDRRRYPFWQQYVCEHTGSYVRRISQRLEQVVGRGRRMATRVGMEAGA